MFVDDQLLGTPVFQFLGATTQAKLGVQMKPDRQLQGSSLSEALARFLKPGN